MIKIYLYNILWDVLQYKQQVDACQTPALSKRSLQASN